MSLLYHSLSDLKDMLQDVYENIEIDRGHIDRLNKKIEYLESEHYKDDALASMKEELEETRKMMYLGFPITQTESDHIEEWVDNHEKTVHGMRLRHGVSGGGYTYLFYPTAIGTSGKIKCDICGEAFEFRELG